MHIHIHIHALMRAARPLSLARVGGIGGGGLAVCVTRQALQQKLDAFMQGKELRFEGNSWHIEAHAANQVIIAGVADLLKNYPQLLLRVHGIQNGRRRHGDFFLKPDKVTRRTWEECFPGIPRPRTPDALALARCQVFLSHVECVRA